jgi:YfiH family protein
LDLVQVSAWRSHSWLQHGFSSRSGGTSTIYGGRSLNLGWTKDDDPARIAENRRLLVNAIVREPSERNLITLRQVHSTITHSVLPQSPPFTSADDRALIEGDGLMTSRPGQLLAIQTADCVPVILIDPRLRVVAAFHAGWRGTAAGIVESGVTQMVQDYGSDSSDLSAAIGPSIGACCYTVGEEVRSTFAARFPYADELFHQGRLDLWAANRRQLLSAGLSPAQIHIVGECTGCALDAAGERKYFSHRIDNGFTGRMMTCVGIAPEN